MTVTEEAHTAFALVETDEAMLAPLTRREASKLKDALHSAILYMTGAYTFENEPPGWFSELAWLENMAARQSANREAAKR